MPYSENNVPIIDDIIDEIKDKSSNGEYIYRGESKRHSKISSTLYREYINISEHITHDLNIFDLRILQKHMLKVVKKHIGEPPQDIYLGTHWFIHHSGLNPDLTLTTEEIELLTQLQHFGGDTNLIDFTTDFLIAVFFACSDLCSLGEDGRVIVLEKTDKIKKMMIPPQNPQHRVIAQKSVFLHPPNGFIDVSDYKEVCIPSVRKLELLKDLRRYHDISAETIYNDIHGFIRHRNIQMNAYVQFELGLTCQYRAYQAEPNTGELADFLLAIEHYKQAIALDPEFGVAYGNLAECYLHIERWDDARKNFKTAKNMKIDIISSFYTEYKNVAEFEEKTGLNMPPDIGEMLGNL